MSPAVEVRQVHKRFGDHVALHALDLGIEEREFISLLGPSGCGKTTLLRIIAGFEEPTRGQVLIHGADMKGVPPHARPTNIVFQRGALFPHMNVAENIGYSLKLQHRSRAQIAARVEELLALVRLEGLGSRGAAELSGGQVQRVALARALAPEPKVLLLDEPLSALDLKLRQHMQLELRSIHRALGATFIFVTHDQNEAMAMSDRIVVMDAGRVVQSGSPRDIYERPASVFASDFIGDTNLIEGRVDDDADGLVTLTTHAGARVQGRAEQPIHAGGAATLSVRPGAIRIQPLPSGDATDQPVLGLPATVAETIYLGTHVRVEAVDTEDRTLMIDLHHDDRVEPARGSSVLLTWAADAAIVWADPGSSPDKRE